MEEVKLELIIPPTLVAAQDIMRPDKHVVRLTYIGEIDGEPVIDEEHTEFRWFSGEEIRAMGELDGFLKELIENNVVVL